MCGYRRAFFRREQAEEMPVACEPRSGCLSAASVGCHRASTGFENCRNDTLGKTLQFPRGESPKTRQHAWVRIDHVSKHGRRACRGFRDAPAHRGHRGVSQKRKRLASASFVRWRVVLFEAVASGLFSCVRLVRVGGNRRRVKFLNAGILRGITRHPPYYIVRAGWRVAIPQPVGG